MYTAYDAMNHIGETAAKMKFNGAEDRVICAFVNHSIKTTAWYNLPLHSGKMYSLDIEACKKRIRAAYTVHLGQIEKQYSSKKGSLFILTSGQLVTDLETAAKVNCAARVMAERMNPDYIGYKTWGVI